MAKRAPRWPMAALPPWPKRPMRSPARLLEPPQRRYSRSSSRGPMPVPPTTREDDAAGRRDQIDLERDGRRRGSRRRCRAAPGAHRWACGSWRRGPPSGADRCAHGRRARSCDLSGPHRAGRAQLRAIPRPGRGRPAHPAPRRTGSPGRSTCRERHIEVGIGHGLGQEPPRIGERCIGLQPPHQPARQVAQRGVHAWRPGASVCWACPKPMVMCSVRLLVRPSTTT